MNLNYILILLPFLRDASNIWSLLLIFVALFNTVISEKITNLYNYYFNNDCSIKIYKQCDKNMWNKNDNQYHKFVSMFAIKNKSLLKIKQVVMYETEHIYHKKIVVNNNETANSDIQPIYELPNDFKCEYKFNNDIVKIQHCICIDNDKLKSKVDYYYISTKNQDTMTKFMNVIEDIKLEYYNNIYFGEKKSFYIYEKDIWEKLNIHAKKTFKNLFIDDQIKVQIKKSIKKLVDGTVYEKFGLARRLGFLFYGVPGSGKTSLIFAIANKYNRNIYNINLSVPRESFIKQIINIPTGSLVVFNDLDIMKSTNYQEAITETEKKEKDETKKSEMITLKDLLEILDGYTYLYNCIIIMTTNRIEKLSPALIRPGRVDYKIEFGLATNEQIHNVLKYYYNMDDWTNIYDPNEKFPNNIFSVSELINSIIMPNIDDIGLALEHIRKLPTIV